MGEGELNEKMGEGELNEKMVFMTLPEPEVKEFVPEGITIHITGTQLNKISNIEIYMKEG